ncbi:peptidoglycan DD-metalloendopeptidase family protein [Candidatus Peribacteria bacterium]|jgi:murein DD-endopeptidase MepM/ murein hydrolase activator NlpD|nr:peptidoglycan DD-metalloendopeptidase family protein [Candidatus Peribacteria bacterium]MBT4021719.1 peptidoglycan DD-metalloendopeptidase family protein [Candidatus Peribacteria bacterium]MBT4241182.1 peptidoglycan DD-metalloendopeptidase family protein [Candidatus Peribacteria bacterium]MBT4473935.1 peptidoglycan DD-metalloendopeptidase family protein [Candidatus Peribacteria bacterium]
MKTINQLRFLIRAVATSALFISLFVPPYVPHAASNEDLPVQELASGHFLMVEEGFVMKTASISEAGHRLAYNKGISHTVGAKESLSSIGDLYGISIDTIKWANDIKSNSVLHPGDILRVLPVDGILHKVGRGQSLSKVAILYDINIETIEKQNQIHGGRIYAGQEIIIPGGTPLIAKTKPNVTVASVSKKIKASPPKATQPPKASPPTSYGVLQKPCDCTYTQGYHPGHYAIDLARSGGGPIFAAEDGIVIRADYGWNGGYGNVIEIDHGNGLVTLYAHNKEIHVREGTAVRRGDVIASMGNTGRVYGKTGIHLHFETILNGIKKSPVLYIQ